MIFRLADEVKAEASPRREAVALRASLDFGALPKSRSAIRFDGVVCRRRME
jgi:hypothetical protein